MQINYKNYEGFCKIIIIQKFNIMKKNYFLLILSFSFLLIFLLPGCKKDSDQEEPITAEDGHHVCKYVNGDYVGHIHHFEDTPFDVSCTADGKKIWVVTDGKELKQGDENGNFSTIDTFGDSPLSVTISSDGSLGYVCTDKGGLCKYVNGEYVGHIHTFDDEPLGVSCTADGKKVWVVTDGRELKQGDENGNFSTIDTFGYTPYKVTLSADGSLGYVITSNKDVCKYVNGEYVGHIYHFDKGGGFGYLMYS